MRLHVYTAPRQPLTRYVDDVTGRRHVLTNPPRRMFTCHECGRRRQAKNLSVQVYYDSSHIFCTRKVWRRADRFPFQYGRFCEARK